MWMCQLLGIGQLRAAQCSTWTLTQLCSCPALRSDALQFLPSVTELVVAQCYYLDFDDKNRNKPIYVYLNSTGCINEQGQAVSADNEFYAIWAALGFTRAPLYTGVWGWGWIPAVDEHTSKHLRTKRAMLIKLGNTPAQPRLVIGCMLYVGAMMGGPWATAGTLLRLQHGTLGCFCC